MLVRQRCRPADRPAHQEDDFTALRAGGLQSLTELPGGGEGNEFFCHLSTCDIIFIFGLPQITWFSI